MATDTIIIPKPSEMSDTDRFAPKPGAYSFDDVPLDDPRVWALFARGDTKGVFQLETQLGQDWAKKVKPQDIEELAALVAILRPGPMESLMSEAYVNRKGGVEEITYLHPLLEPILNKTYGTLIFQEQSLAIVKELAGFSDVESDSLRKGIGKKKPEIIAECKKLFLDKASKFGKINQQEAEEIFGWIEKSVRYQFVKSHAISYAFTAYFCAFQKVHFPTQFYCSWLTYSDWKASPKEEVYELVQNARFNNVTIKPPDIRRKNIDFEISGDSEITFGLSHIRGVGDAAIKLINLYGGELDTFIGFLKTVKKIKRNVAESLIKAGACDCYGMDRLQMLQQLYMMYGRHDGESFEIPSEYKALSARELEYIVSVIDNMGLANAIDGLLESQICVKKRLPAVQKKVEILKTKFKATNRQKSVWEKIYLGLNITCSAADDVTKEMDSKTCKHIHEMPHKKGAMLYAVIDSIRMKSTTEKAKNPNVEYCYLGISDNTGALTNVVVWPETYVKFKDQLAEGIVVQLKIYKNLWKNKEQIVVNDVQVVG